MTLYVRFADELIAGLPAELEDDYRPASPADLVAAVRAGVESGTIEGAFVGQVSVDDNEGMDGVLLPYDYTHTGDWLCIPLRKPTTEEARE